MKKPTIKLLGLLAVSLAQPLSAEDKHPNIIFVLIDDFGWQDVSYNGSTFYETPQMDQLAASGMKFNYAYAASPMCSPTRASIFTGKAPARHGITQWLPGDMNTGKSYHCPPPVKTLKREEVTIAEALKEGGYDTEFLGKWHMGGDSATQHGFDTESGFIRANGCKMDFPFERGGGKKFFSDSKPGEYFTDKITDKAIDIINKDRDKPFFLYLSHFAMHYPIKSKPELKAKFEEKRKKMKLELKTISDSSSWNKTKTCVTQHSAEYAGELFNLDENIGRLVDALKKAGKYDNTIIILTGDNGGRSAANLMKGAVSTSVAPLRGGKTYVYEGGLRTPLIISWPGHIKAGTETDVPVNSMDFYPTLLDMCGFKLRPEQHLDGVSLLPVINGGKLARDTNYWHFPHYQREGGSPASAIRVGDYKLVISYHLEKVELFNLKDDPNEEKDLSASMPEKVKMLQDKFDAYLEETGGKKPTPSNKKKKGSNSNAKKKSKNK